MRPAAPPVVSEGYSAEGCGQTRSATTKGAESPKSRTRTRNCEAWGPEKWNSQRRHEAETW